MNRITAVLAGAALLGLGAVGVVAVGSESELPAAGARDVVSRGAVSPVAAAGEQAAAPAREPRTSSDTPRGSSAPARRASGLRVPAIDATAAPAAAQKVDDEASLMQRLRRIRSEDPELAIQLARDGNARFPESAEAPERASIIVHALAELGRPSEARGEAEQMVNDYPDTPWASEIEAFTGAHPHRNY